MSAVRLLLPGSPCRVQPPPDAFALPHTAPASALPPAAQRGFAQRHMPEYPLFRLVSILYEVVPDILMQTGKVSSC